MLAILMLSAHAHAYAYESALAYTPVTTTKGAGSTITVFYEDQRTPADPTKLGVLRSPLGVPADVRATATPPSTVIPALVRDCLRSTGHRAEVAAPRTSPGRAWAEVVLDTLAMDGWYAYRVKAQVSVRLHGALDDLALTLRAEQPGVSMLAPAKGFTQALDALMAQCREALAG